MEYNAAKHVKAILIRRNTFHGPAMQAAVPMLVPAVLCRLLTRRYTLTDEVRPPEGL